MKALLFSTATLLLLLTASCDNDSLNITEEKTVSPNGSVDPSQSNTNINAQFYTVDAPAGWTKKDTLINAVQFCYLTTPTLDSNFNTNMNVVSESMQGQSLDDYKKNTQAAMKGYMQGFSIGESGTIQSVNILGTWYRYTMQQSGIKMDVINYVFPKNGIAYVITGTTKAGSMDKNRSAFDAVARSFKLN